MLPLLFTLLAANPAEPSSAPRVFRPRNSTNPNVAMQVLPAGGGQSQLVQLCDAVQASDLAGNWSCYYGSTGAMKSGSAATFANVGSPATQTLATCPNGPNCAPVSRLRIAAATDYAKTANTTYPAGSHSLCWLGSLDNFATSQALVAKASTFSAANTVTGLDVTTSGAPEWFVSNGAALSLVSAGTLVASARHLVCGTYQLVGAGTSVMKLYLDGAQVGSTLSTAGAIQNLTLPFDLGRSDTGTEPQTGTAEGVFFTESVLSSTSISQLASATLGALSGSFGEALTFTRASAAGCEDETGAVVVDLPNNRPCVTRAGIAVRPAWTELLLRTSEFDNAAWTKGSQVVAAPTVTANTTDVADPRSSFTAEKISYPSVQNVGEASYAFQAITATANPYSMGVWLRTLSGTATVYIFANDAGYKGTVACSVTTTWSRCKSENFTGTAAATNYFLGVDLRTGSGQSAQPAQTIYAWRFNLIQGAVLPIGGVDAAGSTASVAAEVPSVPVPSATLYSQSGRFFAPSVFRTTPTQSRPLGNWFVDGNNQTDHYIIDAAGHLNCWWFVAAVQKQLQSTAALTPSAWNKLRCSWDGATMTACVNGACNSAAVAGTVPSGAATFYPGAYNVTTYESNGIVADSCLGNSPGACQ